MEDVKLSTVTLPGVMLPVVRMPVIGGDPAGWMYEKDEGNVLRLADGTPLLLADRSTILLVDGLKKVKRTKKK